MKHLIGRTALNAGLVILSLAATALAIEWTVRSTMPRFDISGQLVLPQDIGGASIGSANTRQRQVKNTGDYDVTIDFGPDGLREARPLAQAGEKSILAVGDSFGFGWGVQEPERYSNRLQERGGLAVFNIATPSANIQGYQSLLRYAVSRGARSKSLIVGVCMENDLIDYVRIGLAVRAPVGPASKPRPLSRVRQWLSLNSSAFFMLTSVVHGNAALKQLAVRAGLLRDNLDWVGRPDYSSAIVRSSADQLRLLAKGFDTTILIIPSRGLWVGEVEQRAVARRIHDEFTANLKAQGLHVVDPRPAMEAGQPLAFHFRDDGHWNARGHALAAELLAQASRH